MVEPSKTIPQVGGAPLGVAKPSVSPGNTKPAEVGKSSSPLNPGPSKAVYGEGVVSGATIFDDSETGFKGVDPIYQNFANETEAPKPPEPEEPEV